MNKKLMLIVAGALSALAFTALPGAASAEETALRCLSGPPCNFTVQGGVTKFSSIETPGKPADTVTCSAVAGTGAATPLTNNEATTGEVELTFTGCVETNSGFKFKCNSPGQAGGTVTTNTMITHNLKLPPATAPNEAGVMLTHPNVTFSCAGGLAVTTVTGTIIGEYENKCGSPPSNVQKLDFRVEKHGTQTIREWTNKKYDLESKTNHSGSGEYDTAGQEGTGILTWNQEVELTCVK